MENVTYRSIVLGFAMVLILGACSDDAPAGPGGGDDQDTTATTGDAADDSSVDDVGGDGATSDDTGSIDNDGGGDDAGLDALGDGTIADDAGNEDSNFADGTIGDDAGGDDTGSDSGQIGDDAGGEDLGAEDVGPDLSIVDMSFPENCSGCHGDVTSPAPPENVAGDSETTEQGVGAHRSHLASSDWHAQVWCTNCHIVPDAIGDEGHMDETRPADVDFFGTAIADDAAPDYELDGSCTNVYCHGSTLDANGTNTDPDWIAVGADEAACGTCHAPPGNPGNLSGRHNKHEEEGLACADCHGETIDGSNMILNAALHVDGILQLDLNLNEGDTLVVNRDEDGNITSCTGTCHGEGHSETW